MNLFDRHSVPLHAPHGSGCTCGACQREREVKAPAQWLSVEATRVTACSRCGSPRCPHAADHRQPCRGF